ncbi:MAG: WcaI family glycosyltransferase [Brevundimonas sp.]
MRIMIHGMNYAPEFSGVGRYTEEIALHLAELGHKVCVVTAPPHYPAWRVEEGYSASSWRRELAKGVEIYRCPIYLAKEMRGLKRALASLSFALSSAPVVLWQALRRRPHVVLSVEPTLFGAPFALMAGRLVGARLVLQVQDLEVDAAFAMGHLKGRTLATAARHFERVIRRSFDQIITISNRMAERIVANGAKAERVAIVRNWVDVVKIRPLNRQSAYRSELGLANDAFVALYSGALGAKQGVGLLVEAARNLMGHENIILVIAGDGPMRGLLEAAAEELPNLTILPFQPEERFGEFLALADVHLMPQEMNAADLMLPSKLGGMLASGKPIIVTAAKDTELAEFLGDAAARVEPNDARLFAKAILDLAVDPNADQYVDQRLRLARKISKPVCLRSFVAALLPNAPKGDDEGFGPNVNPQTDRT